MKTLKEFVNENIVLLEKYEYARLLNNNAGEDFDDYICINNSTSIIQLLKKALINDKVSENNVESYVAFLQENIKDICKYLYLYYNEQTSKWAISSSLLTSDDNRPYLFVEEYNSEKIIKWIKSNLKNVIKNKQPK
jgi:hypothetical protein